MEASNIILVMQGDVKTASDPQTVFMTLLGSCVSACMYDPLAGIGGMNHFLLPAGEGFPSGEKISYGTHAMEMLINSLTKKGALKSRLHCKLFGGANIRPRFGNIGAQNAEFARQFLEREGICCVSHSTGGNLGRRVRFWPATGRAQQVMIRDETMPVKEMEVAREEVARIRTERRRKVDFFR